MTLTAYPADGAVAERISIRPVLELVHRLKAVSYRSAAARDRVSSRRRLISLLVAFGIEVLIVLAFIGLNNVAAPKPDENGRTLSTFDVAIDDQLQAEPARQKAAQAIKSPPRPVPRAAITAPPPPDRPLAMLVVSKEVYVASDIAKLGSKAPAAAAGAAPASTPGDSERVGTGPNGEALYAAEWYREPTDQELSFYLPKRMPENGGWGMVACRTVERYHVEDCVELGNSPPGSRLAGAVRQAAWQFLVRPPRVGGHSLVGEWVRIRIDYGVGREPGD